MTIENFVAEVKANTGMVEEVCKRHVVKKYVSFLDKIIDCNRIVNATMEVPDENDKDKKVFKQNTPARFLQLTMVLLEHYTDLEIDEANLIAQYDKLDEIGVLEILNAQLPQNEVNEFTTLLSMSVDDYIANKRTVVAYLNGLSNIPFEYKEL